MHQAMLQPWCLCQGNWSQDWDYSTADPQLICYCSAIIKNICIWLGACRNFFLFLQKMLWKYIYLKNNANAKFGNWMTFCAIYCHFVNKLFIVFQIYVWDSVVIDSIDAPVYNCSAVWYLRRVGWEFREFISRLEPLLSRQTDWSVHVPVLSSDNWDR
jgi:hypothetical protein